MISDELRARIDADMARVPSMELGESLGFLAGYTARFDAEIARGEVTREEVRAYGDAALERIWRALSAAVDRVQAAQGTSEGGK